MSTSDVFTVDNAKDIIKPTTKAVVIDLTGENDDEQSLQDGIHTSRVHEVNPKESDTGFGEMIQRPSMVTEEELVAILEKHSLVGDPREGRMEASSKLVKAYLIKNEPEFVRVMEFRDRVYYPYPRNTVGHG
jgi:hypothetical protein